MSWLFISFSCASVYLGTLSSDWCSPSYHIHDARFRFIRGTLITAVYTSEVKINSTTHRNLIMSNNVCLLVLDRVRHFRLIPIHRFFAVNRIRYRYDTDFLIRSWSGRGAAWLTDQRLQMPPPQLITAVRRGPVAARRRMPLICRGQSNTATISKV